MTAKLTPKQEAKNKGGRPSRFTTDLADSICRRLADGESLRNICAEDDMPNRETVRLWLRERPSFLANYARAREDQADSLWDEAVDKARHATDGASAACARVFLDATAKLAGKLAPKVYGEKLAIETTYHHDPSSLTDEELAEIVAGRRRERASETPGNKAGLH